MLSQHSKFVAPLRLVPTTTDDSAFEMAKAAASTADFLAQYRRERAIEDNKSRLKMLFHVSGPQLLSQAALSVDAEPTYMGLPLSVYEDETPRYDWEQFGGAW